MKILTSLEEMRQNAKPTECGDKMRRTFLWVMRKDGTKTLEVDREINQQEEIDSYKDETLIENIVRKATLDPNLFEALSYGMNDGTFTDTTNMPTTLAEAQQIMIDIEQRWNLLPKEIKAKFENDSNKFISSFGTETWMEAMGIISKKDDTTKKRGLNEQEQ
jgi:hypothetical protein